MEVGRGAGDGGEVHGGVGGVGERDGQRMRGGQRGAPEVQRRRRQLQRARRHRAPPAPRPRAASLCAGLLTPFLAITKTITSFYAILPNNRYNTYYVLNIVCISTIETDSKQSETVSLIHKIIYLITSLTNFFFFSIQN